MIIAVEPTDPRPIYMQIVDEVRRGLVVRTIRAGDPLPSVRQLAGDLRVNPNTVMQAYQELERLGLVEVRRGQGTFVSASRVSDTERRAIAKEVGLRALRDAHRHGVNVDDLIRAIRAAHTQHSR
jgi:GntR family transcriptional regulator